jgi:class 3 adenylate cyclase
MVLNLNSLPIFNNAMKRFVLSLFMLMTALAVRSNPDSLYTVWQDASQEDSVRVQALDDLIWRNFLFTQPDSAYTLAQYQIDFAKEKGLMDKVADGLNTQSISLAVRGDYFKALGHQQKSLGVWKKLNNKEGMASSLANIGKVYEQLSNYPLALDHYLKSLKYAEDLGKTKQIATTLTNIGVLYTNQREYKLAEDYILKGLAAYQKLEDQSGIAACLVELGSIEAAQGKKDTALAYFKSGMAIYEEQGEIHRVAGSLGQIGDIYSATEDYSEALQNYERGLSIYKQTGDRQGISNTTLAIGQVHQRAGDFSLALKWCKRSLKLAADIHILEQQRAACECLYQTNNSLGKHETALRYFEQMEQFEDSIFNAANTRKMTSLEMQFEFDKKEAARLAEQEKKDAIAEHKLTHEKWIRNGFIAGFALMLLFAGNFFFQRNRIRKEKDRSEELLLNILPEEVAAELKEKGEAETQLIDEVTVLFTDFKGFTTMAEQLSPKDLVKDLNICFSEFDRITQKYNIEKIKTIGDAYMAAGGLPTPNTTHSIDVINAALEMRNFIEEGKANKVAQGLPYFEVRIGVHTGHVVAGIVGVKKFQYDIWGDTVNTSSRMESCGEVGKVNISEATYTLVKDHPKFSFTNRGKIEAKGKGAIKMYFVDSNP